MRNYKKIITVILIVLLATSLLSNYKVLAAVEIPQNLVITTIDEIIGEIYYNDYKISVKKIVSEIGVGYCLEINKDYPNGENFTFQRESNLLVENILYNGYPNKTPAEIGVSTENEAYVATQVALWAAIEGYNIDSIYSYNTSVTNALRSIYNNSINANIDYQDYKFIEYGSIDTVQDIVFLLNINADPNKSARSIDGIGNTGNIDIIGDPDNIGNVENRDKIESRQNIGDSGNLGINNNNLSPATEAIPKTGDVGSATLIASSLFSLIILAFINKFK